MSIDIWYRPSSAFRFQIRLLTLVVFQASRQFRRDEHLLTCIWGSHGCRPRRHPRLLVSFLHVYASFFFLWEPLTNVTWVQHVGRVCGSSSFVYSSRVLRFTLHLISQYSQIWAAIADEGPLYGWTTTTFFNIFYPTGDCDAAVSDGRTAKNLDQTYIKEIATGEFKGERWQWNCCCSKYLYDVTVYQ